MPTLTFADGSSLSWDVTSPAAAPASLTSGTPLTDAAIVTLSSPDASSDTSLPTPADVQSALNAPPPRWVATAMRFAKTLAQRLHVITETVAQPDW